MTGISRRNLLKGAAFSAAGVAALGLAGCAPQTEATKAEAGLAETGEAAKHTWEVKPEPIAADQISQTVDTEVLVIGGGYSGSCCALSAAKLTAPITPAALSDPGRERSAPPGFRLVV